MSRKFLKRIKILLQAGLHPSRLIADFDPADSEPVSASDLDHSVWADTKLSCG